MNYQKFLKSVQEETIYLETLKNTLYQYNNAQDLTKEYIKMLIENIDKNRETRSYFLNISHIYLQNYIYFYNHNHNHNDTDTDTDIDMIYLRNILIHFMEELAQTSGLLMFFYNKCIKMYEISIDDDFFKNYIEISDIFCEINGVLSTIIKLQS